MMTIKKVEDFLIGLVGGKENKTETERFVQKKQEACNYCKSNKDKIERKKNQLNNY